MPPHADERAPLGTAEARLLRDVLSRVEALDGAVTDIRQRLIRLERRTPSHVELDDPPIDRPTPNDLPAAEAPPHTIEPPARDVVPTAPPTAPLPPSTTTTAARSDTLSLLKDKAGRRTAPTSPSVARTEANERAHAARDKSSFDFERLLGGRGFMIVGSIVVALAVMLALKLAWDSGLRPPPVVRCAAAALFGLALVGAGEWLRRKVSNMAAAGFTATGLGVMYAAAWAAHGYFMLIGATLGFVLLLAVTSLGVALALRGRTAAVAVLSMVGAYAAPLLLSTEATAPIALSLYWIVLLVAALVLAAIDGRTFGWARSIAAAASSVFLLLFVPSEFDERPFLGTALLLALWGLIHAELTITASRGGFGFRRAVENADGPDEHASADEARPSHDSEVSPLATRPTIRPLLFSPTLTAFVTFAITLLFTQSATISDLDWIGAAALTVVTLTLGSLIAPGLRLLQDGPRTDNDHLGALYMLEGAALFIATIMLSLGGMAETVTLFAAGVVSAIAGKALRSNAFIVYAVVSLLVASGRALVHEGLTNMFRGPSYDLLGLHLSSWSILAAVAAVSWLSLPVVVGRNKSGIAIVASTLGAVIALAALLAAPLHEFTGSDTLTVYFGVVAGLLAGFSLAVLSPRSLLCAILTLALSLPLYLASYLPPMTSHGNASWNDATAPIFLHPGMLTAVLLAGIAVAIGRIAPRVVRSSADPRSAASFGVRPESFTRSLDWIAFAALFVVSSYEVARLGVVALSEPLAQRALVSIYWGLLGVAALALGWKLAKAAIRYLGLTLIVVATGKALIFDLTGVDPLWRVLALLLLGLIMLAVAAVYLRQRASNDSGDPDEGTDAATSPAETRPTDGDTQRPEPPHSADGSTPPRAP